MAYNTDSVLGVDYSAAYAVSSSTPEVPNPPFAVGQISKGSDGSEWVFCQANGAITGKGYVCQIDETFQATLLSTSNDARGDIVGVPFVAFADNEYGWFQRKGPASVRVSASAAANAALNTTGTGGQIDDDATTGAFALDGVVLTTANGGSAGLAAGMLDYPKVGGAIA